MSERKQRPRTDAPPGVQPGSPLEREAPLRILVLDDDQVDRMALRRALARTGVALTIREAEAVLPALGLLATEGFDCVFLDYNLPDGDGLTFLLGMRAAGIEVPVVMLTGQQDERIAARLTESGAADYIAKGDLTPARLAESLRRALP
ncbi:MAG TPA: response regulator [Longimicrobium sp.]|jgi:PleD family two-component response regulator